MRDFCIMPSYKKVFFITITILILRNAVAVSVSDDYPDRKSVSEGHVSDGLSKEFGPRPEEDEAAAHDASTRAGSGSAKGSSMDGAGWQAYQAGASLARELAMKRAAQRQAASEAAESGTSFASKATETLRNMQDLWQRQNPYDVQHSPYFSASSAKDRVDSAAQGVQDIWGMFNPYNLQESRGLLDSRNAVRSQLDKEPCGDRDRSERKLGASHPLEHYGGVLTVDTRNSASVDHILVELRTTIRLLSDTHNALLASRSRDESLLERTWIQFLHSYPSSYADKLERRENRRKSPAVSKLAAAAREFVDVVKKNDPSVNIDAASRELASEILSSINALKAQAETGPSGARLPDPMLNAVDEMWANFTSLNERWTKRLAEFGAAAKPIRENIASNEYVVKMIGELELLVADFKEELWRVRTEWTYRHRETLSWAREKGRRSLQTVMAMGMSELHRVSAGVNNAKDILRSGLGRSRQHVAYLQQHASRKWHHFGDLLILWMDVNQGVARTAIEITKSVLRKTWRAVAFFLIIAVFRALLTHVQADAIVRQRISNSLSRMRLSLAPDSEASISKKNTSQTKSEDSVSRPREAFSETSPATHIVTRDPNAHQRVSRAAVTGAAGSLRGRRDHTGSPGEGVQRRRKPLEPSNFDYGIATSVQQAQTRSSRTPRPFTLGGQEIQLVYDESPLPEGESTRTTLESTEQTDTKTASLRSSPRLKEKRRGRRGDQLVSNSIDESRSVPSVENLAEQSAYTSALSGESRTTRRASTRRKTIR